MDYRLVFRTFAPCRGWPSAMAPHGRNAIPADVRLAEGMGRTAILDIASRELKDFWKGGTCASLCI